MENLTFKEVANNILGVNEILMKRAKMRVNICY